MEKKFRNSNAINYDEDFIRKYFDKYTIKELAEKLSRHIGQEVSAKNLSRKINKMGLSKLNKSEELNLKEFVSIPYFSNYKINKNGVIIHAEKHNIISRLLDRYGYYIVKITDDNGKKRTMLLHRLLCYAFKPCENMLELEVNHINGIKKDISLDNLEWVTTRENLIHARKNNLNNSKPNHKKINSNIVKKVYLCYHKDKIHNYAEISRKYNVSPLSVKRIVMGERYNDITEKLIV